MATSFAEIPRKLLHIRSTISKTIVGFKSSIKTSKDCKKAKCLSCGDIKVARGIPIIPIAMCDKYDFGLHYKLLSKLSREERVTLICRISLN